MGMGTGPGLAQGGHGGGKERKTGGGSRETKDYKRYQLKETKGEKKIVRGDPEYNDSEPSTSKLEARMGTM